MRISANIIVRNEEKKILRCLLSFKSIAEEIILVHDGVCKDNTIRIAKEFGAKTFVKGYVGEAEPHRKFAINKSSNDWILQIDADEYLTPNLVKRIHKLISDKYISGYYFKWNISFPGEKKKYDYKLALYRKSQISEFFGIPHESVKLFGKVIVLKNVELGHDRSGVTREQFIHKSVVWPMLEGKYTARYKYKKIPIFLLPFGYVAYPFYRLFFQLLNGKITNLKQAFENSFYAWRFWHSFCLIRFKEKFF